eukprot:scaffold21715_cov66-Phaeocystis_antarctica.AAC.2
MGMGMGMRMRMRARLAFAFACLGFCVSFKFEVCVRLHTSTLQHAFLLLIGGNPQSAHATRDPALCHVLATYQVTASCDVLCEADCLCGCPDLALHRYVTAAAGHVHGLLATAATSVCTVY